MSSADRIKGKAKEVAGKVTGNKKLEAEGKTQNFKGKAGDAAKDAKDSASGVAEGLRDDKDD